MSHHSHLHTPGQVLTVGQGDVGQLGLGEDVMERKYPQTVCGGDIQGKSVIQVTCGGMHTVALSEDGNVRKLCIFNTPLGKFSMNNSAEWVMKPPTSCQNVKRQS